MKEMLKELLTVEGKSHTVPQKKLFLQDNSAPLPSHPLPQLFGRTNLHASVPRVLWRSEKSKRPHVWERRNSAPLKGPDSPCFKCKV